MLQAAAPSQSPTALGLFHHPGIIGLDHDEVALDAVGRARFDRQNNLVIAHSAEVLVTVGQHQRHSFTRPHDHAAAGSCGVDGPLFDCGVVRFRFPRAGAIGIGVDGNAIGALLEINEKLCFRRFPSFIEIGQAQIPALKAAAGLRAGVIGGAAGFRVAVLAPNSARLFQHVDVEQLAA
jgi:hypothetical protein